MKRQTRRTTPALAPGALILFVALIGSTTLFAQIAVPDPVATLADATPPRPSPAVDTSVAATPVSLLVGRSTLIDMGAPIARVSLTSADIADAMVTSPSQLLLHGKTPGSISMLIWSRAGEVTRYEIAVQRDLTRLTEQVKELFPNQRIQVHANGRQVVLSGSVNSQDALEKAKSLAAGFVERADDVVVLLQLQQARSNQVLLKVRFAEVSRNALTELGVNFFTSPTGINNTIGRVTTEQFQGATFSDLQWSKEGSNFGSPVTSSGGRVNFADFLNVFLLNQRYDLGLLIRALQQRGIFQSLAEPNLVAESGKEAAFLAGGEFPVPVAQAAGNGTSITVEYKEFGIRLNFTPTVDGDRVHLKVRPEVSTLDYGNAVVLQGFRIPALSTRRTETELELMNGQTFAIAGLINNQMSSTLRKIPGIGDIPILGLLFQSKAAEKGQTELVVMITPEILPIGSSGVTGNIPRLLEPFLPTPRDNQLVPPPPPAFVPGRSQLTPMPEPTPPPGPRALADPATAPAPEVTSVPAAILTPPPTAAERAAQERVSAQRTAEEARQQKALAAQQEKEAEELARAQARADKAEAERVRRETELARKAMEEARKQADRQEKVEVEQARKEAEAARKVAEQEQKAMAERLKREAEEARKAEEQRVREEARQREVTARQQQAEQARLEKLAREQARRDAEAAKVRAEAERKAAEEARKEAEREAERQREVAAAEARLRTALAEYQAKVGKSAAQ